MTKSEFRKIQKILAIALAQAEKEAIADGVDIRSEDYDKALGILREKILNELGLTLERYEELRISFKIPKKPLSYKELVDTPVIPIPQETLSPGAIGGLINEAVSQIPKPTTTIVNKIVKETIKEKPQIIKTIEKTKEIVKELDTTQLIELKKDIQYLQEAFQDFKIPEFPVLKDWTKEIEDLNWRVDKFSNQLLKGNVNRHTTADAGSFTTAILDNRYMKKGEVGAETDPVYTTWYNSGSPTLTSLTIGANTLNTTEWAYLDGQDQAVKTTSSPTFANLNLTTDNAKINFGTGTDAYIRYTGTNWEFGLNLATTAIIFNSTGRDVDFKVGGSSGYIFTGDAALNSLTTGLSYVYGNYALSGGYSSTVGTSGYAGIAYGQETRVNQGKGAAFNMGTLVDGEYGTSHGYYTRGQGRGYFTAGYNTDANTVSFLAGDGTDNAGYGQIVLGYASGGGGSILTLSLGDAGQRYEVNDVLAIAGGTGGTATVTGANALGDYAVTGVTLASGGSGYVASETPGISGGNADATVTIDSVDSGDGSITGFNNYPSAGGSGYSGSETLTISAGNNDATIYVDSTDGYGAVTYVSLTGAGTGYSVGYGIATTGGGNNDCTVDITSVNSGTGAITGITLLAGGTGYSVGTGVALSGGSGSSGTVDITSVNAGGEITSVALTDAGSGYTTGTKATSYAGAGTGATISVDTVSPLGRMIAQKTGSVVIGQDLQANTNPNVIMLGKGFAETTEKSFNVGFDSRNFQVTSNGIGFFGTAAATKQTALTTQLTTITHTAPGTPDYAIQNMTQTTPWGFATQNEANSVLKVIANLQTRVAELETKLKNYGLLQ